MPDDRPDTELGFLLQLAGHELRSPLGAVNGYIRMLLKQQLGPLTEAQERVLSQAEQSCGRLKNVLDEMSHLARMDRGEEPLKRIEADLNTIAEEAIAALPEQPERTVAVGLEAHSRITLEADPARLRLALSSVVYALRRELVATDRLVVRIDKQPRLAQIAVAAAEDIEALAKTPAESLHLFNEFRGGCGLKLPIARRIVEQHGGHIHSTRAGDGTENKAAALVRLPLT